VTRDPPDAAPRPDPRKLKLLVERLRAGAFTYDDLAALPELDLSRRSLQLYLETHLPAAGFAPLRGRTAGPKGRATFTLPRGDDPEVDGGAVNRAALALAKGVLADLFPIDRTDLDLRVGAPRVLAIASGVPRFELHHMRALMRWIAAAERDRPTAVRLRYRPARGDADGAGAPDDEVRPRLAWPLGVILRDGRRVYLPALVEPADSMADRRLFALERVAQGPKDCGVIQVPEAEAPPTRFLVEERPRLQDLVQAGFGLVRPDASADRVDLHVRFDARQAPYVRARRWHSRQRETELYDGGMELRFGPVELREAVAWCSQWIDGVTVLGDARLRDAYEQSLDARLRVQRATPAKPR
jgi:hypothetical protein